MGTKRGVPRGEAPWSRAKHAMMRIVLMRMNRGAGTEGYSGLLRLHAAGVQHTEKFPRHHRYGLGLAIENRLQTILDRLLGRDLTPPKRGRRPKGHF